MRFALLGFLALVVAATAMPTETNAARFARGLPPLPPASIVRGSKIRSNPSHPKKRDPAPSTPPLCGAT
ncbi:hypothetical protein EV401DRAFT_2069879 [Pisolithus croceorrhizus]|nr:hypothetical protein EV401DRAFT_2069879 [Pisolithus croceorrhizus]